MALHTIDERDIHRAVGLSEKLDDVFANAHADVPLPAFIGWMALQGSMGCLVQRMYGDEAAHRLNRILFEFQRDADAQKRKEEACQASKGARRQ
jgi:hypothetical protein